MARPETRYQAWRRPRRDKRGAWQKVAAIRPATRAMVFEDVQREMWKADWQEYDYAVLPVGVVPQDAGALGQQQQPMSASYRTKRMRPA